jgi:uncharacterized protein YndB with AHSA1/START domain
VDALPGPRSETNVVEREIRIEAGPETVFPYFTDPEKMVRWMGVGATLDPRPGGVFSVNMLEDYFMEGEYLVVQPYRRVVFTWGYGFFPDDDNPLPPGSSTVEVTLVPEGDGTLVRLRHRVPADLIDFHAMGWENYLSRLLIVAGGGNPGPDPFIETVRSMLAWNE